MLLRAYLYNLAPGKAEADLIAFDRRVTERFTSYFAEHGRRYLGVYRVEGSPDHAYAELSVVDAASVGEAQSRRPRSLPSDVADILAECDTYTVDTADLWLDPIVLSPNASIPLDLARSLVRIYLFQLVAGTTVEQFAAWERQITGRYSEVFREIDWYYAGAFTASGIAGYNSAGVDIVRADSPDEALARDAALPEPPDITRIVTECRAFMEPRVPRRTMWLRPLSLSALASGATVLAPAHAG